MYDSSESPHIHTLSTSLIIGMFAETQIEDLICTLCQLKTSGSHISHLLRDEWRL